MFNQVDKFWNVISTRLNIAMINGNFATLFEKYVSQEKTFQIKFTHFFGGKRFVEKTIDSHLKNLSLTSNDL